MKLSASGPAAADHADIHLVRVITGEPGILTEEPGVLGGGSESGGGNSGFQALNLAVQFGAARVILVGFDMRLDRGVHWHGRHPPGLNNPSESSIAAWRKSLNAAAGELAALGVEVINASPVSTVTAYPVMTLEEALAC